jgi:1,4-alpha-glucan branching enzyme
MGTEFGQPEEWNHDAALAWRLLEDPMHAGVRRLLGDLNALFRGERALHARDFTADGFRWVVADDRAQSVLAWLRMDPDGGEPVLVACNFTPVPRDPQHGRGDADRASVTWEVSQRRRILAMDFPLRSS